MDDAEIGPGGWPVGRAAHEDLRGDADQPVRVADLGERFCNRGGGTEDDDVGRHQSASRALFVREQLTHHGGIVVVHRVEDLGALFTRHLGQQVGEVVVFHFVEHAHQTVEVETLDDPQLLGLG